MLHIVCKHNYNKLSQVNDHYQMLLKRQISFIASHSDPVIITFHYPGESQPVFASSNFDVFVHVNRSLTQMVNTDN